MREINKIIVHCSDSEFGDADTIDHWHKERGWDGIGYHYVITNGVIQPHTNYSLEHDGLLQIGRDIEKPGAHCKGHNGDSIGICLIGRHHFTANQLYQILPILLQYYMDMYAIDESQVFGHRDFNNKKTCPNIHTKLIRQMVAVPASLRARQVGI